MASTLSELRTLTRDNYIKIDPNGKIFGNTVLDSFLNRADFQLQKDWWHKRPQQYANYTVSTVAGTQEYDLPSDFIKLDLVRYNGSELAKASKTDIKRMYATMTSGNPFAYYIYWTKLWLYPVPNTTGTIDLDYFKKLPTMTSAVDSTFPEDFDDARAAYASYLAFNSVNKPDKAQLMFTDYSMQLNTLLNSYIYQDLDVSFSYQNARWRTLSDTNTTNLY